MPVGTEPVAAPAPRPKPEYELTDEERAERNRQHEQAVLAGRQDPGVQYVPPPPPQARTVLIHILEDGFTAFGQVWFRGQELEVQVNGPRWENARLWILLDDFGQMALYGKINFRHGPWPGVRTYTGARFQQLRATSGSYDEAPPIPTPDEQALRQAEILEARRGRSVPAPSMR